MRYAQLVCGPAGSGKSTYCSAIRKHGAANGRTIHVVNLDPAAENFDYECLADIRQLIHLNDVMADESLRLGPNGGLVFCMEYFADNFDWLEGELGGADDDYILFDCPGQIELYTHVNVMRRLVDQLQNWNFRVCGVFLLDTQFMLEISKFFAGTLVALSTMVTLEVPHVNILTKMDLLNKASKETVEEFLEPDSRLLQPEESISGPWKRKFRRLSMALGKVIDDYSLVRFITLDITDDESMEDVLLCIDSNIQFGEDADVKINYPEMEDDDDSRSTG